MQAAVSGGPLLSRMPVPAPPCMHGGVPLACPPNTAKCAKQEEAPSPRQRWGAFPPPPCRSLQGGAGPQSRRSGCWRGAAAQAGAQHSWLAHGCASGWLVGQHGRAPAARPAARQEGAAAAAGLTAHAKHLLALLHLVQGHLPEALQRVGEQLGRRCSLVRLGRHCAAALCQGAPQLASRPAACRPPLPPAPPCRAPLIPAVSQAVSSAPHLVLLALLALAHIGAHEAALLKGRQPRQAGQGS